MPVEVRELVIKGFIDGSGGNNGSAAAATGGNSAGEDLVKACVEKVLQILKEKQER